MYWKIYSASFVSGNRFRKFFIILLAGLTGCFGLCLLFAASENKEIRSTSADDKKILRAIPKDCVGAYVSFQSSIGEQKTFRMLASLISAAGVSGAFDANQQIIADIAFVTIELTKYPHAIFVQNISAKQVGERDSFMLAGFSGGIIIRARKETHTEFLALLKKIIDHYFTSADARITWVGQGKYRHQKLTARELPAWASWEWISLDDYFLFTIGEGVFGRAVEAIEGKSRCFDENCLVRLADEYDGDISERILLGYVDVARLREMLNPVMKETLANVLRGLGASELRGWLFSSGFTGRAFISKIYLEWPKGSEMGYLTNMIFPSNPLYKAIPPQASSYGVSYIDVSEGMNSIVSTYLQSRNSKRREKLIRNYNKIMKRAGLSDVDKLIFRHLGPVMIIHDWPSHPLGWPFAKTFIIQHDRSRELADNWNKVLPAWRALMRKLSRNERLKSAPIDLSDIFSLQLDCTEDGIWFVHVGPIVLAAAGLQDRFLVISHSPLAVRVNIRYLDSVFSVSSSKHISKGLIKSNRQEQ